MAEELVITDPIQPPTPPATTKYKVISMQTDREAVFGTGAPVIPPEIPVPPKPGLVVIRVKDDAGNYVVCQYNGDEAMDLIKWLNTANFSVNSMQKRVLQKLVNDGKLPPGTVTGTPDSPTVEF